MNMSLWCWVKIDTEMECLVDLLNTQRNVGFYLICIQLTFSPLEFFHLALSYSEPVDLYENGQMASFSQIGPPQNLTLEINERGEYILSWERPEYGFETLRYYILKWWKEPENVLYGEIKTPDYAYIGEH